MEIQIEVMNDHFTKMHLGNGFVLHKFTAADGPDADFHDHPWGFITTILRGGYREEVLDLQTGAICVCDRWNGAPASSSGTLVQNRLKSANSANW